MNDAAAEFLEKIADKLAGVNGIDGVVLGGSRARGTNAPDSDYDIGVYYADETALDLKALAKASALLDDQGRAVLIAPPGAWGNWVNGGGWLVVDGVRVDIILRDTGRVERAVADCLAGNVAAHYQTGHPHAYLNVMYAGEIAIARILRDAGGRLAVLRRRLLPYPGELRRALLGFFGFEAGFSHMLAAANADRGDAYYVAAHIVRSLSCLNQVLFAVNEEYCINEKGAVRMIDGFPEKPPEYAARVSGTLALAGTDSAGACAMLESLVRDVRALAPVC